MLRMQRRASRSFGGLLVATALVVGALVTAGVIGAELVHQPFRTVTVDRTPPVTLQQLRDLAEYRAASADFEVLVDIEKDVKWLPSAVAGERTFFVGVGSVDATVDFGGLTAERVTVAEDRTSVVVVLPHARLGRAVVDPGRSHVAARSRGITNRLADAFSDNPADVGPLYEQAAAKIQAAADATELQARAERNTAAMLTAFIGSFGYAHVEVRFASQL